MRTNEGTNRPHLLFLVMIGARLGGNRIHLGLPRVESHTAQALFDVPKSIPIQTPSSSPLPAPPPRRRRSCSVFITINESEREGSCRSRCRRNSPKRIK